MGTGRLPPRGAGPGRPSTPGRQGCAHLLVINRAEPDGVLVCPAGRRQRVALEHAQGFGCLDHGIMPLCPGFVGALMGLIVGVALLRAFHVTGKKALPAV